MRMRDLGLPQSIHSELHNSPDSAAEALTDAVSHHLAERLLKAPRASLVVSGGSTPLPFFRRLREKPLDWPRIDIVLADERWVSEDDDASNTRMVKQELLQGPAAEAQFYELKQPGNTPEQAMPGIVRTLESLTMPLDALILGMGADGHTASLFPDAPELVHAITTDDLVAAVNPPSQSHSRVTLTLCALRGAGFTALHLKGNDKLTTLKQACSDLENVEEMPVRAFIKPGLHIFYSD